MMGLVTLSQPSLMQWYSENRYFEARINMTRLEVFQWNRQDVIKSFFLKVCKCCRRFKLPLPCHGWGFVIFLASMCFLAFAGMKHEALVEAVDAAEIRQPMSVANTRTGLKRLFQRKREKS